MDNSRGFLPTNRVIHKVIQLIHIFVDKLGVIEKCKRSCSPLAWGYPQISVDNFFKKTMSKKRKRHMGVEYREYKQLERRFLRASSPEYLSDTAVDIEMRECYYEVRV